MSSLSRQEVLSVLPLAANRALCASFCLIQQDVRNEKRVTDDLVGRDVLFSFFFFFPPFFLHRPRLHANDASECK